MRVYGQECDNFTYIRLLSPEAYFITPNKMEKLRDQELY